MELNLMSTDLIYPNINVVFDDSIFDVDEDPVFTLYVNEAFNAHVTFPSYANRVGIAGKPYNFNQPLSIPAHVNSAYNLLVEAQSYNQPIVLPNNVTNASYMLRNCYSFNAPVTFPANVSSLAVAFYHCNNYNQPTNIPSSVRNCYALFDTCTRYNQPTNIPNGVVNCYQMFYQCDNYNQPITIPSTVNDVGHMFEGADNFNSPVTFANGCTTADYLLFWGPGTFNAPVTFADTVVSLHNTFYVMRNFNQPVNLPAGGKRFISTFNECCNFNQPVIIPNGATNCERMFDKATMFNSVVFIPPTVVNTRWMFSQVNSMPWNMYNSGYGPYMNAALKQPIYFFANSIMDAWYMFDSANSLTDIYILGVQNNAQLTRFMHTNGSTRRNIYTDDACQNHLYNTSILNNGGKPTWSNDLTNGCIYNVPLNLYIYNNWDGHIPDYCRLLYIDTVRNRTLYQEYLVAGSNGTFEYGSNEWSDVPNGAPVTGILNNITTDMNVYYVGSETDYWVRQKTNISAYNWSFCNSSYTAAGSGSDPAGVVIDCNDIACISWKATLLPNGYIQFGKLRKTGSLPTVITSGTDRIAYTSNLTGYYFAELTEDIFLGGHDYDVQYAITFRSGAVPNNGVRFITKSTGGSDATMSVTVANNATEDLIYTAANNGGHGVDYGDLVTLKYPYSGSSWGAIALANVTDGINNYNSGELIKSWSYSTKLAFTVWPRE